MEAIRKVMAAADVRWPSGLPWPRAGGASITEASLIHDWAATVANPQLVILDTLAGVRADRNARETIYEGDYKALRDLHLPLRSNEAGIAVLVLTHQRKLEADDPIDTISGSLGLAGCADTSIILAQWPRRGRPSPSWPGRRRAGARGHVQRRNLQMDHPGRRR